MITRLIRTTLIYIGKQTKKSVRIDMLFSHYLNCVWSAKLSLLIFLVNTWLDEKIGNTKDILYCTNYHTESTNFQILWLQLLSLCCVTFGKCVMRRYARTKKFSLHKFLCQLQPAKEICRQQLLRLNGLN